MQYGVSDMNDMEGRYNLSVSFAVQFMPKLARDYLYQFMIPVAKRRGLFVNEYPCLEDIYKDKKDCCVCLN